MPKIQQGQTMQMIQQGQTTPMIQQGHTMRLMKQGVQHATVPASFATQKAKP